MQFINGAGDAADGSPLDALIRFYRAFNGRDLESMEWNWDREGACSMSNPLGGLKRGWAEIGEVYRRIFHGEARVYVEFYDYTLHETPGMFVAVGRERGHIERGAFRIDLAIRTTRVFHRVAGGWRQLHHHGSIDDPELLARYQALVSHTVSL